MLHVHDQLFLIHSTPFLSQLMQSDDQNSPLSLKENNLQNVDSFIPMSRSIIVAMFHEMDCSCIALVLNIYDINRNILMLLVCVVPCTHTCARCIPARFSQFGEI